MKHSIHACSIDETQQGQDESAENKVEKTFAHLRSKGVRTAIVDSHLAGATVWYSSQKKILDLALWLYYGCTMPGHSRRKPVDVDKTVSIWAKWIPEYALAHDADSRDAADARVDELLSPILAAPVAQLREFFGKLVLALKANPHCPYIIWRTYEVWHDRVIKPAKNESIIKLKKQLAEEIVELVDPDQPDIKKDIRDSMINALMWREPERLEEVKEALVEGQKKGVRPQVKGRQSCLFLQVPGKHGKLKAEVML